MRSGSIAKKTPKSREQTSRKTCPSPLIGKLFDEGGDRLSPSHTTKRGRRYRSYISRGYVTGRKDSLTVKGWRLPAAELERFVAQAIRNYLLSVIGGELGLDATVQTLAQLQRMKEGDPLQLLFLVLRAQIREGVMNFELDAEKLAETIGANPSDVNIAVLAFEAPFIQKRRGGETRLVMSDPSSSTDQTLIANIARGHVWLDRIKQGATFDEIAVAENTTKKRVQQTLEFAFQAPDIVRDTIAGQQPVGLTSTWCRLHDIPVYWQEQRARIATL